MKKNAYIIRDFADAGTGQNFTAGETVPIEEGQFRNYKDAGLIRAADGPAAPDAKPKAA